jgi:hypothetical protein
VRRYNCVSRSKTLPLSGAPRGALSGSLVVATKNDCHELWLAMNLSTGVANGFVSALRRALAQRRPGSTEFRAASSTNEGSQRRGSSWDEAVESTVRGTWSVYVIARGPTHA